MTLLKVTKALYFLLEAWRNPTTLEHAGIRSSLFREYLGWEGSNLCLKAQSSQLCRIPPYWSAAYNNARDRIARLRSVDRSTRT